MTFVHNGLPLAPLPLPLPLPGNNWEKVEHIRSTTDWPQLCISWLYIGYNVFSFHHSLSVLNFAKEWMGNCVHATVVRPPFQILHGSSKILRRFRISRRSTNLLSSNNHKSNFPLLKCPWSVISSCQPVFPKVSFCVTKVPSNIFPSEIYSKAPILNIFPSKIFSRYAKVLQLRGVQLWITEMKIDVAGWKVSSCFCPTYITKQLVIHTLLFPTGCA